MANKYWLKEDQHIAGIGIGEAILYVVTGWEPFQTVHPLTAQQLAYAFRRGSTRGMEVVKDGEDIHTAFRERGVL